ncbi:IS66 family insertion sequence element accessory protein TnpB [Bradyrhizobium sp. STM 3561]|uniref:IS66 family insertion sequence element accessory protein TnpB n=1 Tax=Bradyrhizobium sp. STM 3561 TaxID=578923 RepID=UPI0038903C34
MFALTVTWTLRRCSRFLSFRDGDDPDSERRQGLDRDRHTDMRRGMQSLALAVQESLKRDPHAGDLYIFRGRRGDLVKILWHDGLGMSLYAKRLDRGKFIWPSASDGAVSISAAQMAYMLEGIDWRNPQLSWRPLSAG